MPIGRIPQIDFSGVGGLVNEFDRSRANAMQMRAARDQMAQQRQAQQWASQFDPAGMTRAQQLQSALQAGAVSPDRYFGHLPTMEMDEYQRARVGMAQEGAQREQQLANEQAQAQILWATENLPNMTEKKALNLQRAGAMPKLMDRWLAKPDGAGTKLGKLREDLEAGHIDQEAYKAAVEKELSPSGVISVEMDENGRITRMQVGGSGAGLTTGTKTEIQKKQLDAVEMGARTMAIRQAFRPEYQTIGTRLGVKWNQAVAKVNPNLLSDENKALVGDFANYRAGAIDNVNRLLNELSGAAVSPQEATRLRESMPDPGDGIFGGDDPVSFKAKIDRVVDYVDKALVRYQFIQEMGMPGGIDQIPVGNIKKGKDGVWMIKKGKQVYRYVPGPQVQGQPQ